MTINIENKIGLCMECYEKKAEYLKTRCTNTIFNSKLQYTLICIDCIKDFEFD